MAGWTLESATEPRLPAPTVAAPGVARTEQPWRALLRRLLRNHIGMTGAVIVVICVGVAVLAPILAPYGPEETHPNWRLYPPNEYFVFGTDEFGRDILSRIMYGAQVSLEVGLISVSLALVAGGLSGLIAGFFGGWSDAVIMRCMDVLFAFPAILLAIGIMAVLGTGIGNAILAIGIVYAPAFARLTRASVLSLKQMEFVQSARVLGSGDSRILSRHVLPNITAPLIVQISFSLSTAILTEAALSFLGLGTPPSVASWGSMLSASRRFVELDPWPAIFPGLAIMLLVLGFNLFGDGLRDVLDPRLRA
ncbi:MAG: ABC transporter permease [Chloroflexi bacterium]|nr:ABC transporter permease [Chloroflexota bacterium]